MNFKQKHDIVNILLGLFVVTFFIVVGVSFNWWG